MALYFAHPRLSAEQWKAGWLHDGAKGGPAWLRPRHKLYAADQELLGRVNPVGRRLDELEEKELCRWCGLLAMFEACFRAGSVGAPPHLMTAIRNPACTVQELLALVPGAVVDDICLLSSTAYDAFPPLNGAAYRLNPTFAGSDDVGGADADIIIGNCLLDIKATRSATHRPAIYQLVGYALLDYDDAYGIREVGFYLARRGLAIQWPLDRLLDRLSGGSAPPLQQLRASFRDACKSRSTFG